MIDRENSTEVNQPATDTESPSDIDNAITTHINTRPSEDELVENTFSQK